MLYRGILDYLRDSVPGDDEREVGLDQGGCRVVPRLAILQNAAQKGPQPKHLDPSAPQGIRTVHGNADCGNDGQALQAESMVSDDGDARERSAR